MMDGFYLNKRIYYHDTDAGGVVYYGSYLEHLEEARTEYLRSLGIDVAEYGRNGILFPVVHLEVDYKSPARYADEIRVYTAIEEIGNASIHLAQEIKRGDIVLVKARTIWACVDDKMKARRVPEDIKEKFYNSLPAAKK
ncbi:MAG: YbgC/FadM family acyl-CoA thioesterase [Candidatus Omnitrophica bacterium]|nr:YbgC/FadM family acyl-CoA thioesterase [Candidatus Omnitrophota bacterium]